MTDHYGRHEIEARQAEEKRNPPAPAVDVLETLLMAATWVGREQASLDAWVAKLPPMVVTLQEFKELSDYSASYPTGTTPGKRWRAELNSYNHRFVRAGGKPRWIIRQYDPGAKPYDKADKSTHGDITIFQYRPVFRVKAGSRPHA